MTFEILRKQPLIFHEKNGFKVFDPFIGVDKKNKQIEVCWNDFRSSVMAKSPYKKDVSLYDIGINNNDKSINGISLVANPQNKGIGELLNLSSIILMKENIYNKIKVFSLRETIQFYAKYGFNIVSDNISEILHNLKYLTNIKDKTYSDYKNSAKYFEHQFNHTTEKKELSILSNNLTSDYIRELAKNGKRIDEYDLYNHTHMEFSSLDMFRNKTYLNELLEKHKINYEI